MAVAHFTQADFSEQVLKSTLPVLVDFYADWCGPCRALTPIIEELEKEYEGKIKIGKLDVDEEGKIATEYEVMSIPTLIFFKDGQVVEKLTGLQSKDVLKQKLTSIL
ncbi:thioredoxin [Candidatus Peregrinibacteria bacterium]|nr:thioredoxin [Candidatus Peregrinibacteria bacterium]